MYVEFFVGEWLEKSPFLYSFVHEVCNPFLCLCLSSLFYFFFHILNMYLSISLPRSLSPSLPPSHPYRLKGWPTKLGFFWFQVSFYIGAMFMSALCDLPWISKTTFVYGTFGFSGFFVYDICRKLDPHLPKVRTYTYVHERLDVQCQKKKDINPEHYKRRCKSWTLDANFGIRRIQYFVCKVCSVRLCLCSFLHIKITDTYLIAWNISYIQCTCILYLVYSFFSKIGVL